MLKFSIFICATIVAYQFVSAEDLPVICGPVTSELARCIDAPPYLSSAEARQCDQHLPECERMTCVFRKSGWLDGDKLEKAKMSARFDEMAKTYPEWAPAFEKIKVKCLTDLPPQGIHLNCPAYDVAMCIFDTIVRNSQTSHWKSDECSGARQFVESCPICHRACFRPNVPVGTCNCLNQLKSS